MLNNSIVNMAKHTSNAFNLLRKEGAQIVVTIFHILFHLSYWGFRTQRYNHDACAAGHGSFVENCVIATNNDGVLIRLPRKIEDFLVLFKDLWKLLIQFSAESSPENTMPFFKSAPDTSKLL